MRFPQIQPPENEPHSNSKEKPMTPNESGHEQLLRDKYPHILQLLENEGWSPQRQAELPSEEETLGFVLHAAAEEFLSSFSGLSLTVRSSSSPPLISRVRFGVHEPLKRMDPAHASFYVDKIAGTSFVFPVSSSGSSVGFMLEDGRLLSIDETWRGCSWNADILAYVHWRLFLKRLPGTTVRTLDNSERPVEYQWD